MKRMIKKTLGALLILTMVFALLQGTGTAVFADEGDNEILFGEVADPAAQIGSVNYSTLQEAVNNAPATPEEATVITLLKDVTECVSIPSGKKIELDLNEKTLTADPDVAAGNTNYNARAALYVTDGGSLSVKNGTIKNYLNGTGSVEARGIFAGSGSKLPAITDVTFDVKNTNTSQGSATAVYIVNTDTKITGTVVTVQAAGGAYALYGNNGEIETENTVFNETGNSATAFYLESGASAKIKSGKYTGSITLVTSSTASISGGLFTSDMSSYTAEGCSCIANTDTATKDTYAYMVAAPGTVALHSRVVGGTSPVAQLTGGKTGTAGESLTVSASTAQGRLTFKGWYTCSTFPVIAADKLTLYSESAETAVTVNGDLDLIAVYEPASGTGCSLYVSADEYTIGDKGKQTAAGVFSYTAGSEVSISYTNTGKELLYWTDENGKIISLKRELKLTVTGDTAVNAVTVPKGSAGAYAFVVFTGKNENILSGKLYYFNETIVFPTAPAETGFTFDHWSMTSSEIVSAMALSKKVNVKAVYREN